MLTLMLIADLVGANITGLSGKITFDQTLPTGPVPITAPVRCDGGRGTSRHVARRAACHVLCQSWITRGSVDVVERQR
jgi:hypothetical protein